MIEKAATKAKEQLQLTEAALISQYIEYLTYQKKLASNSVQAYQRDLQQYSLWLAAHKLNCLEIDQRHIMQFLLFKMQSGAKASSSARTVSSLKNFYTFLQLSQHVAQNPCATIKPPVVENNSGIVMTFDQVERLLESPDLGKLIGIRDRAMLELLYATGISISELISIKCDDIDLARASLTIASKGAKHREIPLISSAVTHIKRYIKKAKITSRKNQKWFALVLILKKKKHSVFYLL